MKSTLHELVTVVEVGVTVVEGLAEVVVVELLNDVEALLVVIAVKIDEVLNLVEVVFEIDDDLAVETIFVFVDKDSNVTDLEVSKGRVVVFKIVFVEVNEVVP